MSGPLVYLEDFYYDKNGLMVFTEAYHLKRGSCCGSGCLHCPYDGITEIDGKSESSDTSIQCPFCHEFFSIPIFKEEGDEQFFVYDCEVCCRPIEVRVDFSESDRPKVSTRRE